MYDFGDAKVTATAAVNDEVSAFVAIKSEALGTNATFVDESWVKFTEGFGTVKVGYYGWNIKENLDIIKLVDDIKSDCGINAVIKASDAVTVDFFTAQYFDKSLAGGDGGFLYGVKIKYDTDVFGVSLATGKNSYVKDAESPMSLNAYYKLDAFTVFMNYIPEGKYDVKSTMGTGTISKVQSAIIGATYDSADSPIYARAEFDVQPTKDTEAGMGFRIGYKINGAKLEYQTSIDPGKAKGYKATSQIKLNCAF